ncbi:hypothetical protein BKA70DRAFT_1231191 [Coprinopsis sp. MPI-PUGE-AT-0042]|nr:hypothetical protein BKA70DRAFT_1231191 [Coprinopsis sp. MPI-PUGE-AT-0042]
MDKPVRRDKTGWSKAQKRAAHAEDSSKSYYKRREAIAQRRKVQRDTDKAKRLRKSKRNEPTDGYDAPSHNRANDDTRHRVESNHSWYIKRVQRLSEKLDALLRSEPSSKYLVSVAQGAALMSITDSQAAEKIIDEHLEQVEKLSRKVKDCEEKILQHFGAREELDGAIRVRGNVQEVVEGLKAIYVHLLEGNLCDSFENRRLPFQ